MSGLTHEYRITGSATRGYTAVVTLFRGRGYRTRTAHFASRDDAETWARQQIARR